MNFLKKTLTAAAAVAMLATPSLRANDCCAPKRCDTGCGYEDSCCGPNYYAIGIGVLTAAALVVAIIALTESNDNH